MLRGRFWFQNKDFGASVGAICIIFRDLSVPTYPRVPGWGDGPRTGRSPERGGRQNGQTLARTAPARSVPDRKPDWRSRQVGQNARTARTPERQIDNSLPVLSFHHHLKQICLSRLCGFEAFFEKGKTRSCPTSRGRCQEGCKNGWQDEWMV